MTLPKKTEKMTTGIIEMRMVRVSYQEMIKRKMKQAMTKMSALINMATLLERPSWITPVSEAILLTKYK